jgi:hypothetical protein
MCTLVRGEFNLINYFFILDLRRKGKKKEFKGIFFGGGD